MKFWSRLGGVLVVALLLQLTMFSTVRVVGVAPELLVLVAVLAGFFVGPDRGALVGFVAGLLWDLYLPAPIGVAAFTFAMVAFAVGALNEGLFHESRSQLLLVAGIASAASMVGYAIVGTTLGTGGLLTTDLIVVTIMVGVMNAVLAPVVAPAVRWVFADQGFRL